jgi:pimeloyl-ACP methyl ester carboxylesterase
MNRDNGDYFPEIRGGLLDRGIAVASFDKRGVGESTGNWHDTDIAQQARDVAAQLECLRKIPGVDPARLGLFGHSQGGLVVLEVAAADPAVPYAITNSAPGVTMAQQERFATEAHMTAGGAPAEVIAEALAKQDALIELVRAGAGPEVVRAAAGDDGAGPTEAGELDLLRRLFEYDPRSALEKLACPLLAIFGGADLVVPVEESIAIFRAARAGKAAELDVETIRGGNHRLQIGDPPALAPTYEATLTDWILRHTV